MISRVKISWEERENFLAHLRISREGLAIFDEKRRLRLSNPLFDQYSNLISDENLLNTEDILNAPDFSKVTDFLNQPYLNENNAPFVSYSLDKNGKIFKVNCIRL